MNSVQFLKNIPVMSLNCYSVTSVDRQRQLSYFIKRNQIKIVLLQETFLKPHIRFRVLGFKVFRNDSSSHGGGTAILVSSDIKCIQINVPTTGTLKDPTAVRIFCENCNYTFISTYIPNNVSRIQYTDITKCLRLGNRVIMGGDFNAKHTFWNCSTTNARGKDLFGFYNANRNFVKLLYPTDHTHFPFDVNRASSTIDLFLIKGFRPTNETISVCALWSDHNPIIFQIPASFSATNETKLDYSCIRWATFRREFRSLLPFIFVPQIQSESDLNHYIALLEEVTHRAIKSSTPLMKPYQDKLPPEIEGIVIERNIIRRHAQNYHLPVAERKFLSREANFLGKVIKVALTSHRNDQLKRKLSNFKPYDTDLFKLLKNMTSPHSTIPSLKGPGSQMAVTAEEKSELLASTNSMVHNQNTNMGSDEFDAEVSNEVDNFLIAPHQTINFTVTPLSVKKMVRKLKNRKAPGPDRIRNEELKNLPDIGFQLLAQIVNFSLCNIIWPQRWKTADITPVLKPGKDPSLPTSYRPISKICNPDKLEEKFLVGQVLTEARALNVFPNFQFGFRKSHSTAHALLRMTTDINSSFNLGEYVLVVVLDIEKAFDTTWHKGLIYKMIKFGFSPHVIKLTDAYLSARKFTVTVDGSSSCPQHAPAGVPQGSNVGPVYFNIYYSDVPVSDGVDISNFADDTKLSVASKSLTDAFSSMQRHLNRMSYYFKKWKIKVNASKTEYMIFTRRMIPEQLPNLYLDGVSINRTDCLKYLGIKFDQKLLFTSQANYAMEKSRSAEQRLSRFLSPFSSLLVENKIMIYLLFIRSIMTSNSPIWNFVNKTVQRKLEAFQNRAIRKILGLRPDPETFRQIPNDVILNAVGLPTIREFTRSLTARLLDGMLEHENPLIKSLTDLPNGHTNMRKLRSPFLILNE